MDEGTEVEEDEGKGSAEDGVGVGVDERAGDETPWGPLERLETAETESEELPTGSWRLCSQCRFSSTSLGIAFTKESE